MSIDYMRRVWANKDLRDGALLLMLALADHANDAGECWPSQPHLEDKTRLTARHVRRLIDSLAQDGYVEIVSRGRGRTHKAHYRLCPDPIGKADNLSKEKRTICPNGSDEKADICDSKSGHSEQEKADICAGKADIGDEDQSHARSKPPIEPPLEEPSKEPSSSGEEEEKPSPRSVVHAAWQKHYGEPLPANLIALIDGLTVETSADAVIHAIEAAVAARSRNFGYIAKCARNYVPPAPPPPAPSYTVDLPAPGVYALPVAPRPVPTVVAHAPLDHSDPWADALAELRRELPGGFVGKLEGSTLEAAGAVLDNSGREVALYRVLIAPEQADSGLSHFIHQCGRAIRVKLCTVLHKTVQIEIVAAPPPTMHTQPAPQPQEEPAHA